MADVIKNETCILCNRPTAALDEKIDNLVFDLYGLTPEEREIVKGVGK